MTMMEENEISKNANGGTEISKRTLSKYIPEELSTHFQVIPSRVRELDSSKIRIYWQHDLPEDPEISHLKDENSRNRFHKFVFVSNWQLQEYITKLNFPQTEKVVVIENPIEIFEPVKKVDDKINLVYFSTPQRGLNILVPVFKELSSKYPNAHLHVFSSFKLYGWEEPDKAFLDLFKQIEEHPQMTYYGAVSQEELREKLKTMHILAFPSTWKETSCRVLIESMSAGLMCVHPNYGALPETSGGLTTMYQYHDDINEHANIFARYLEHAISVVNTPEAQNYFKFVKMYADSKYEISKISSHWNVMMTELLEKYPTAETRAIQEELFLYKPF
jgi:glycosyltransferase involved in cell wall biosynthesis